MLSLEEIDWSKAPDGATHYSTSCICPWLKESPPSYFVEDEKVWVEYGPARHVAAESHLKNAVKRPQKMKNIEWNGYGIPPIGTACEYLWAEGQEWRKCKVVAYYFEYVVAVDTLDISAVCQIASLFRPIKTPEQIVEEKERLQTVDEMLGFVGRYSTFKDVMESLYDAGYRKQGDL